MVILRHEEDSKFLHDYKLERQVENKGEENALINQYFTRTEREAAFEKGMEMRNKEE